MLGRTKIKEKLTKLSQVFSLGAILTAAEQLGLPERWRPILGKIFDKYLDGPPVSDPMPTLARG